LFPVGRRVLFVDGGVSARSSTDGTAERLGASSAAHRA
jgi:hypothetical protein